MPLCAYQDARMRNDETVVENAFIRDYMPFAPNSCVKVYLYGLMQCQNASGESSALAFGRALGMDEDEVKSAFEYWHEKGLVSVSVLPGYAVFYKPVRSAMPLDESMYEYADFNEHVQAIFTPRVATPAELSRIYDWMDVFSLEQDAIPILLEYGRSRMKDAAKSTIGSQISYIDRIASQWAEEGIRSSEQASKWVENVRVHASGISSLMRRMGMNREPQKAEKAMYESWVTAGFSSKAILAAADKMTGAYNPSFKYLDSIIQELLSQGATDEKSIQSQQNDELCKEAITALGIKNRPPSANQMRVYRECVNEGFEHEYILLACEIANTQGKRNINDVKLLLLGWKEKGLTGIKKIRQYEKKRADALADMKEIFSCMGLDRRPAEADIKLYNKWIDQGSSVELLLYAAECSHSAKSPYKYMQKLVDIWHNDGINSVSAARKAQKSAHDNRSGNQAGNAGRSSGANPALAYPQRSYAEGELDYLLDEL